MKKKNLVQMIFATSLLFVLSCEKSCQKKASQNEAGVFFENLENNQEVTSPLMIKFGVKGKTVRPALEDTTDQTSGHHHILIDNPYGFVEKGMPVPMDARHIHYGKGESSAILDLPEGVHTLSLQFADGAHVSYGKEMAATITVKVVSSAAEEGAKNDNE